MRFGFDDCILDLEVRQLLRGGQEIAIPGKAFNLLCVLVERQPVALDRATLMKVLWPDVKVSPGSLDEKVAILRRALNDDARQPRYIKNHHGFGFSFCGRAVRLDHEPASGAGVPSRFQLVWKRHVFTLMEGENVIGRNHDCQVRLDDPTQTVSRWHAKITCGGAAAAPTIEDLGSTHGTKVGGSELTGPRQLIAGDVIQLARVKLTFQAADEEHAKTRKLPQRRPAI